MVQPNWHAEVFFGIHYDLHASPTDTALGAELTAEHLRERLLRVQPDWIHCDCKGHPGYTSWPTKVGSPALGIVQDALQIHREVTRELGIKLGMHYSGVWDSRAIELHPDWARIDAAGTADINMTCRLSAYADELMIPQMLELIDNYDVDGFWVDGENWASHPCWCPRCRAAFMHRSGYTLVPTTQDDLGWADWLAFHRQLFVEYVARYTDAVHTRKPTCTVCSNWMYTACHPDPVAVPLDYLSGDYDPSFGANRAALEGRVIATREMPWDLMAWSFTKTGAMTENPPWMLKPPLHLQQELSEVVALGGAVMVYDQPQRSGWLTGWHQDLLAAAAAFCRARQATCWRSRTVPQAAVLHLAGHYYAQIDTLFNAGTALQPVEGALHALLENHISTDILTEAAALAGLVDYKLVVVPEQTRMSAALTAALEAFAAAGGHVLLSGAHLAHEVPTLVGAIPADEQVKTKIYVPVADRAVPVSGPWQPVLLDAATEPWLYRLAEQEPTKDATDQVIVTQRQVGAGSVVAVHGPVFRDYALAHYPLLRQLIGNLMARLSIPWVVTLSAPPRVELILRQQDDRLVVNLINRGAAETLSPQRVIVEELAPVDGITLAIRYPRQPRAVTLEPGGHAASWTYADAQIRVALPRLEIHTAVVIE
ncbi:MAG: alpha-L-fucosidase [Roseiflexaceae bacterium]|nr:alpha-L-fucosidase [Roseiflexaceae bacterium]